MKITKAGMNYWTRLGLLALGAGALVVGAAEAVAGPAVHVEGARPEGVGDLGRQVQVPLLIYAPPAGSGAAPASWVWPKTTSLTCSSAARALAASYNAESTHVWI